MQYRFIQFLLIIYIFMSWVPSCRETTFGQFLGKVVEPYLGFFQTVHSTTWHD